MTGVANDLQNSPVITNAFGHGASTIISGKLNSRPTAFFSLMSIAIQRRPGGYGEGQFYAGTVSVTTDGSGNASFRCTNTGGNYAGQYFTATATSATGDTSEFSLAVLATNPPVPAANSPGLIWRAPTGSVSP